MRALAQVIKLVEWAWVILIASLIVWGFIELFCPTDHGDAWVWIVGVSTGALFVLHTALVLGWNKIRSDHLKARRRPELSLVQGASVR